LAKTLAKSCRRPRSCGRKRFAADCAIVDAQITVETDDLGNATAVIDVNQNNLVRITLTTENIPHSFTIDRSRIATRVDARFYCVYCAAG